MSVSRFLAAAFIALCAHTAMAQTPIDASSSSILPTVLSTMGSDGTLDVAWRGHDGRVYLSEFTGAGWQSRIGHVDLGGRLPLLAGLARDEAGNRYVAVMSQEQASPQEWSVGYRPGVAHILKVAAGGGSAALLADVNQRQFTQRIPIINPLSFSDNAVVNGEMVHSTGTLALAFGHNNGQPGNIHSTGSLIGIGTDGSVRYGNGGEQHPMQVRLAADGAGFVAAQIFDQGIGLSTLKPGADGTMEWSDFVLVYEIPRQNPYEEALSIGGIIVQQDRYLLVFSSGNGWLADFGDSEHGRDGSCRVACMSVGRDFHQLPKFDWYNGVRHAQGNFPLTVIAAPEAGRSFVRPVVSRLEDGRSMVAFEQWHNRGDGFSPPTHEGTRAVLLNQAGQVAGHSPLFEGIRIQRSSQAFTIPFQNRIGWVTGDAANGRLLMHTLDDQLNLTSIQPGRGVISGATPVVVNDTTETRHVVDGNWDFVTETFRFTLKDDGNGGLAMDTGGLFTRWTPIPGTPNSYRYPGTDQILSFTGTDDGSWQFGGQVYAIRKE